MAQNSRVVWVAVGGLGWVAPGGDVKADAPPLGKCQGVCGRERGAQGCHSRILAPDLNMSPDKLFLMAINQFLAGLTPAAERLSFF